MKKYLLFLAVCFLGFVIGIVASHSRSVMDFYARPVVAQSKALGSISSAMTNKQEPRITTSGDVERVIEQLNKKATEAIRSTWVHIREVKKFDTDLPNNGVLPNGMAVPNEQINDIWHYIDEQGMITKTISIMRDKDGNIVQVGVGSNGTSWNSATGEVDGQDYFQLEGLDGGFLRELMWLKSFGSNPVMKSVELPNGHPGVQVEIVEKFDEPLDGDDYKVPIVGAETVATFDSITGYLISWEKIFYLQDGSKRVFSRLIQEVQIEPPTEEVLTYFDEKERRVGR